MLEDRKISTCRGSRFLMNSLSFCLEDTGGAGIWLWDFTDRGHSFRLIRGCFLRELGPKGSQALLIWKVKLGAVKAEGKSHQTLGGALSSPRADN